MINCPAVSSDGFSCHREMVGVAFFQVGKQQIDGALIFLVVLAGFAGVDQLQQGNKVHLLGGAILAQLHQQVSETDAFARVESGSRFVYH